MSGFEGQGHPARWDYSRGPWRGRWHTRVGGYDATLTVQIQPDLRLERRAGRAG